VRSLASWTEVAVGASLVAIGALGMKEAREWKAEDAPLDVSPSEVWSACSVQGSLALLLKFLSCVYDRHRTHLARVETVPSFSMASFTAFLGTVLPPSHPLSRCRRLGAY
jgi:hypothetical protein